VFCSPHGVNRLLRFPLPLFGKQITIRDFLKALLLIWIFVFPDAGDFLAGKE